MILDSTGNVINWDISFPSPRQPMMNQRIIHIASLQGTPDGARFSPVGTTALMRRSDWKRIEGTTYIYENPSVSQQDVTHRLAIWTKYRQLAVQKQLSR